MEKENRLGTEKIPKLLMEFAIPAIIGMMVNGIYNIVDRIFIGNDPSLGSLGLAAVSITYPVTLILLAFGLMVAVGGATIFSISLGKKETDKAQHYLGNALTLAIILGALFMIFGNLFMEPILIFLGASANVLPYAEEYLSIILYGAIFQAVAMTLNNFARADGSPRVSMISMLIGAGFNIVFDYIFIVQMGWGMAGAAYATIGGQFLSMVWQLFYFLSARSNVKLKIKNMALKKIYIISILSIGIPAFMLQIANSVLNIILNNTLVNYGGDIAISVAGIITSAVTLIIMFVSGLIQGMQPITSYNYGARKSDRVKEVLKLGSFIGGVITTLGFLVIQLFPEFVVMLFNQEPAVVELGVPAIRIWVLAFPLVGVQIVWANYFQAIGEVRLASFLNLMRQIIVLIPLIILFSNLFGLYGIYFAVPASDLVAFGITTYFFKRQFKRDNFN